MKFHKEGYPTLLVTILFNTIIICIAKLAFPEYTIALWFAYILSGALFTIVVQFFRHPTRVHTINDNAIVAPADGEVVVIEETEEAVDLAYAYIAEKVVGQTSYVDCLHIALATIHRADFLISWNFKHIVNVQRIMGYNSVNLKNGYKQLEIRSPRELLTYEDDN